MEERNYSHVEVLKKSSGKGRKEQGHTSHPLFYCLTRGLATGLVPSDLLGSSLDLLFMRPHLGLELIHLIGEAVA